MPLRYADQPTEPQDLLYTKNPAPAVKQLWQRRFESRSRYAAYFIRYECLVSSCGYLENPWSALRLSYEHRPLTKVRRVSYFTSIFRMWFTPPKFWKSFFFNRATCKSTFLHLLSTLLPAYVWLRQYWSYIYCSTLCLSYRRCRRYKSVRSLSFIQSKEPDFAAFYRRPQQ